MKNLHIPLNGRQTNYAQPFIMIAGTDSYETVLEKFRAFRDRGIWSAVLQYGTGIPGQAARFDETYFDTLRRMSRACRELGMTYWVQDAAPFPTGSADG